MNGYLNGSCSLGSMIFIGATIGFSMFDSQQNHYVIQLCLCNFYSNFILMLDGFGSVLMPSIINNEQWCTFSQLSSLTASISSFNWNLIMSLDLLLQSFKINDFEDYFYFILVIVYILPVIGILTYFLYKKEGDCNHFANKRT